jgi:hypothetical protein
LFSSFERLLDLTNQLTSLSLSPLSVGESTLTNIVGGLAGWNLRED